VTQRNAQETIFGGTSGITPISTVPVSILIFNSTISSFVSIQHRSYLARDWYCVNIRAINVQNRPAAAVDDSHCRSIALVPVVLTKALIEAGATYFRTSPLLGLPNLFPNSIHCRLSHSCVQEVDLDPPFRSNHTMDCLPTELTLEIFRYLEVSDLCAMCRTSSYINPLARSILYKQIRLTGVGLPLLIHTLVAQPHASVLIKILRIFLQWEEDQTAPEMTMQRDLGNIDQLILIACNLEQLHIFLICPRTSFEWFPPLHALPRLRLFSFPYLKLTPQLAESLSTLQNIRDLRLSSSSIETESINSSHVATIMNRVSTFEGPFTLIPFIRRGNVLRSITTKYRRDKAEEWKQFQEMTQNSLIYVSAWMRISRRDEFLLIASGFRALAYIGIIPFVLSKPPRVMVSRFVVSVLSGSSVITEFVFSNRRLSTRRSKSISEPMPRH
jgi:F-box-like